MKDADYMIRISERLIATNERLIETSQRVLARRIQIAGIRAQLAQTRQVSAETRERTQEIHQERPISIAARPVAGAPSTPHHHDYGMPYSRRLCHRHGPVSLNRHGLCPRCYCEEAARCALAGNPISLSDRSDLTH
jgi:hypothetical protein